MPTTNKPATATCGKVRYRDRVGALLALSSAGRRDRDERRAYPCPTCRGWHLTSQAKQ